MSKKLTKEETAAKEATRLPILPKPTVYLVAGPSGIGKTWLCGQLSHLVPYVNYDVKHATFLDRLYEAATLNSVVLIDMPIQISTFIKRNSWLYDVKAVFIEESEEVHVARLWSRGGEWTNSIESRRETLKKRAERYGVFKGTQTECLEYLRNALSPPI